jgi:hypothetical protein
MSAFTDSGHSTGQKLNDLTVCFRPEADIERCLFYLFHRFSIDFRDQFVA